MAKAKPALRATQVVVAQLKKTADFENERIEVTVEIPEGFTAHEAVTAARSFLDTQFSEPPTEEEIEAARHTLNRAYSADTPIL